LKGIRLGDLGKKMGDNANDTGFMILENVRIPRTHMLSKYRTVTPEGVYTNVVKADPKVHYTTMMTTRAMMVNTASGRLAQAATMAIRYNTVREQGFESNKSGISFKSQERQLIDHKIGQYRLFKQLATAYGLKFTARFMMDQLELLEGKNVGVIKNTDILKELSTTAAGLKSLTSIIATSGAEDCRKCCGGNGYLLSSGIAPLTQDYLWQVTAEGDFIILGLHTARHLLNCVGKIQGGSKVNGVVEYLNVIGEKGFDLYNHRPNSARSSSDFLNLNHLLNLFKYASIEKIYTTTNRFNQIMSKEKLSFDETWNRLSDDLLKASYSHCYYIIMTNYVAKVNEMKDPVINKILTRLCALFAISNFLDNNWSEIFERDQYRLMQETVNQLLSEIRPDCISLVDAFDYPDNVLKSSIGRYDGNVYEALFDAAQKSIINRTDPFFGYDQYLKPHTNKALLKHGNKPLGGQKF
jgi:acyl-CoA oxidase